MKVTVGQSCNFIISNLNTMISVARPLNYHYQILFKIHVALDDFTNEKPFRDRYHKLSHCTYFSNQRSAQGRGPRLNKFEQVSSLGHQMSLQKGSSSEPVWSGLQSSPPDVTSKGHGLGFLSSWERGLGPVQLASLSTLNRMTEQLWKHCLPALSDMHMLTSQNISPNVMGTPNQWISWL